MSVNPELRMAASASLRNLQSDGSNKLTPEDIAASVDRAIEFLGQSTSSAEREELIAELERSNQTWIGSSRSLVNNDGNWSKWLDKEKADIPWPYWNRYRAHLLSLGRPMSVVDAVDSATDETLGNLNSPGQEGMWDRRGMVVGHVQSGKTANYVGLICKAADAGYKVIIVLTGFHNSLRTQTQIRLEEGFVGYDKHADGDENARMPVGVGIIDADSNLRPDTITTRADKGDFSRSVARNFGRNLGDRPLLFVIKKNASVLKNLVDYLEWASNDKDENGRPLISKMPLLLIDDEADQGSVDTKKKDWDSGDFNSEEEEKEYNPTTLNKRIRQILFMFSQSAYVGYTATPFANIFIHRRAKTKALGQDLFPRSFITVIPTPSNYIGPDKVFGLSGETPEESTPGLPIVRKIKDYAASTDLKEKVGWMPPRHDRNHIPMYDGKPRVPPSLKLAVQAFILGCSARMLRNQENEHCSMLVHVTRLIDVQDRVFKQVSELIKDIADTLQYGNDAEAKELRREFRLLWKSDFVPTTRKIDDPECPEISWDMIEKKLATVALSVKVRRINGTAGDVLDYENYKSTGLNVIAIGGDKLSRGLTLEGLIVSYFTRPTRMYDTLMQMGRWFGFRDGFLDICRLYAPKSLIEWFGHIADASAELRHEFVLMYEKGETPATYGQRVLAHPVLLVTSQVKSRHTEVMKLSYSGAISETIVFSRDADSVNSNIVAAEQLVDALDGSKSAERIAGHRKDDAPDSAGKYLWRDVDVKDIIRFLGSYKGAKHARKVHTDLLAEYIEKQVVGGTLLNWSVLLAGKKPETDSMIGDCMTGFVKRAIHPVAENDDDLDPDVYRIRRLVSPTDESWDLSLADYKEALRLTRSEDGRADAKQPGGPEIRAQRTNGDALLIIYPLAPQKLAEPKSTEKSGPYIGFAISFPGLKKDKPITYRVDKYYQDLMNE